MPVESGLSQKYAFIKNPQFLSDHYLTKDDTHEDIIMTKFCNDRVKIVNYLVKAYFWPSPETTVTHCNLKRKMNLWFWLKIKIAFIKIGLISKIITLFIILQVHNAEQLSDWCLSYLSQNYNGICRKFPKILRGMLPENQASLNVNRWPPIW